MNFQIIFPTHTYLNDLLNKQTHQQICLQHLSDKALQFAYNHLYQTPILQQIYQQAQRRNLVLQKQRISWLYDTQMILSPLQFLDKINNKLTPPRFMNPLPEDITTILDSIIAKYGYIPNLQILLLMFPQYLKFYTRLEYLLLQSQTAPIEQNDAYLISLMAASTYGCVYLFSRLAKKYKQIGGDLNCLKGKGHLPQRLQNIKQLNGTLAYSPWACNEDLFLNIIKKSGYNKLQLNHIIVLLSFFHATACLCLSNGLQCDQSNQWLSEYINLDLLKQYTAWEDYCNKKQAIKNQNIFSLEEVAEEFQNEKKIYQKQYKLNRCKRKQWVQEQYQQNRQQWQYPRVINTTEEWNGQLYMKQIDKEMKSLNIFNKITTAFSNFLLPTQKIQRFDTAKFSYLEYSTYNFKYGTFVFMTDLDNELALALSHLIEYTKIMTNHKIGNKKISTQSLRRAIRFYYQNLSGYRHEDYNYRKNMTDFMSKEIKFYIKVVTYYPFLMETTVLQNMPHQSCFLSFFDSIHISLLAINTKMELAITMATRVFKKAFENI